MQLVGNMNKLKPSRLLLLLLVFLFIYTPPILSFNILHLASILSYTIFFLKPKYRKTLLSFVKTKTVFIFILLGSFSSLLLFTTIMFTTKRFLYLYNIATIYLQVFPIAILVSTILIRNKYSKDDVMILLLDLGFIQALVAIAMFIFPNFKSIILDLFYSHYNEFLTMSYWVQYRVFGLSQGMMYAMPITQGFLASVAFLAGLKISTRYYWYIPIMLFSAIINARIGVAIFLINVIVIIILNTKKWKVMDFAKMLMLVLIFAILAPQLLFSIESKSEIMFSWVVDGYNETVSFFRGEKTGYYNALSNMFFLPEMNTMIFGSGQDYFFQRYKTHSTDIGYINDLFLGGVFFTTMLYASILFYLYKSKNKRSWHNFFLPSIMVITMLISNIKGYGFRQNEFVNLFILISTILLLYDHYYAQGNDR